MSQSRPEPVVVLRADSSPTIGGGHAMRCLTLANELSRRGARCVFVAVEMTDAMHHAISAAGHRIVSINAGDWSSEVCQQAQAKATAAIATLESATHLVIDHYQLGRLFAAYPGLADLRTLAIDDLADRPLACDLLVDQTVGRDTAAYRDLAPGARLLVGGSYALLRPQFAACRPTALQRRVQPRPADRLLVSLGSTDLGGITAHVLEAVRASDYRGTVDIVLGLDAPSRKVAEKIAAADPRFVLHADVADMAGLMLSADLAIGAAGTTTWERCALGLPTLTLVLADNQHLVARKIVAAGAGMPTDLDRLPTDLALAADAAALATMSAAAFALVDGAGTARVVDAFLESSTAIVASAPIALRPATAADSEQLWLWRNDPMTRERSQSRAPIRRSDHERWFNASLESDTRQIWMAECNGCAIASTRIDQSGNDAVVSIMVAPDAQGKGVGAQALAATCARWEEDDGKHATARLRAVIHSDNVASLRIFSSCGFRHDTTTEALGDGFCSYVRSASIDSNSKQDGL